MKNGRGSCRGKVRRGLIRDGEKVEDGGDAASSPSLMH